MARQISLIILVALAVASRLLPHPLNFAPITALALFGGAHFRSKAAGLLIPLIAMLVSDFVIGFHSQMATVYGSFVLIYGLGRLLRGHVRPLPVFGASLAGSALFFVITNFGIWAFDGVYPQTGAGLADCFVAAIPFFQNTVAGDLAYSLALFGSFALAERFVPALHCCDV